MKILHNINLKEYNTFAINVISKYFVEINNEDEIQLLIESDVFKNNKHYVISGGSNVLFLKDYDGLIIKINIKSIKITEETEDYVIISAGAGENWHNFVEFCVDNNYYGLENLAYIPGCVGSAPVQNIGAYNVEQKDYFHCLKGYNLITDTFNTLEKNHCMFDYRDSVFKNQLKNKFIITNVSYKLSKIFNPELNYKELKAIFYNKEKFCSRNVFDAIVQIRKAKLPDPKILGNAGSFFKNPIISKEKYDEIHCQFPEITGFEFIGKIKLSAGLLIDLCGLKGIKYSMNSDARVYEKHALILVNYNNASGNDIYNLSTEIINKIYTKFGVELQREVNVVK